ncbi:unnamed protein product [Diabrotica balteata]|uniref:C2H2-type domain-containing protein n=1 Tax=Diabrotica balteata TaxID=107213 RepID=A0A9P0GZ96_DIABA|nr:unnamed protein product [Diabrotica balteata]
MKVHSYVLKPLFKHVKLEMELNQGCEDSTITEQNLLISSKGENSVERYANIKSEFEECKFESNYTEGSQSDAYCANDIKIEQDILHYQIDDPSDSFVIQEVKTEIKKELEVHILEASHGCETQSNRSTKKIDSNRDIKLEIGTSTEIDDKKHCRSMKTSNLISRISRKRFQQNKVKMKSERSLITHTGENSYKCETCLKEFTVLSYLKRHLRVHTGEKPYKCEICFRLFTRADNLRSHMRSHTGEKPYKCEFCFKQFSEAGSLKKHLRMHTGENPYTCELCFKQFSRSDYLKTHLRRHSAAKPYKCEICCKQFSLAQHLKFHLITHTEEKPSSVTFVLGNLLMWVI